MDIKVYATGSSGNCSCVDGDVMFDAGVTYGSIPEEVWAHAACLFITHVHGDHFNPATIKKLYARGANPNLVKRGLYVNAEVRRAMADAGCFVDRDGRDHIDEFVPESHVVIPGRRIEVRRRRWRAPWVVDPFRCPHGSVECEGFSCLLPSGETLIWATDTETMAFAPDVEYDALCVEGNWDEDLLFEAMASSQKFVSDRASTNTRHLSVGDFEEFVRSHSHEGSTVVQLHMSSDFGVRSPLNSWPETVNT